MPALVDRSTNLPARWVGAAVCTVASSTVAASVSHIRIFERGLALAGRGDPRLKLSTPVEENSERVLDCRANRVRVLE